ncbi:DUF4145 domain-containing protein [Bacillus sp. 165]|uniref:DUF4145 domain-containing protein n=1 Tax=Bacillus sp. 165 TaxID=1529117 RepID=UPI001AD9E84C|nr:DUF4145 domain-containing protein [Bacillus sp. 165]MBO9128594.1 DUF4145 domain-containing protein [Bacillus sp. 165]
MPNDFLFEFVRQFSSELAELAYRIENQLLDQPHASMMQARLYNEQLVKIISKEEKLEEVYPLKISEQIHKLYRQNVIEEDIYLKLEWIRKKGNKAVHNVEEVDIHDALQAHKFLFEISVWYMQVYVSYNFEVPVYKLPVKTEKETNSLGAMDMDSLIKPYLDETLQKMDDMWSEVQKELEVIRQEKGRVQTETSTPANKKVNKITTVSKEIEDLYRFFKQNNFTRTNTSTKAIEFEHATHEEFVYLLFNKEITIVLNPNTVENNSSLQGGKKSRSTALRKFPKEINNGKTPINYGYSFKFETEEELDSFLHSLDTMDLVKN